MKEGEVTFTYSHSDRYIAGSAVPTINPIQLETIDILKMPNFLDRREMGIINVGGKGSIVVEGITYKFDLMPQTFYNGLLNYNKNFYIRTHR